MRPAVDPEELGPLLDEIEREVDRYLQLPEGGLAVVVLFPAHTYCLEAFNHTPRLFVRSVDPGSGKTQLLDTVAWLSRGGERFDNASGAAIYRSIDGYQPNPPTYCLDEADGQLTSDHMDKVHIINAGFGCGGTILRCETAQENYAPKKFKVFSPVAIAGLADLPQDALITRCITLDMMPCRTKDRFDARALEPRFRGLGERLDGTMRAHVEALRGLVVRQFPPDLSPRERDKWLPLFQVAELAGGRWPKLVWDACVALSVEDQASKTVQLLEALRAAFGGAEQVRSSELVERLKKQEGFDLLTTKGLATRLKKLKVHPHKDNRGSFYRAPDFSRLWEAYLGVADGGS